MTPTLQAQAKESAMSTVVSMFKVPEPTASPAAHWTTAGRLMAAGTLVLGAGFQFVSFLTMPANDRTVDRLHWIADHPHLANLATVFALLAMPFLFGTALVYVLLSRRRSPRLAYAGGLILGTALVGLSAIIGFETLEVMLVQSGYFDLTTLAVAADHMSLPPAIVMLLIFIPFAFFGLLTSAAALWRSRAAPRAAVLLIPAFIVVDFFLQWGIAGHAISFVGACWIASAVLMARR